MGCSQSKIENEEAVARCKDRKHFMKEAVSFRNAFAAAHSSYATYLKSTGAALSDFAQGDVQNHQLDSADGQNLSMAAAAAAGQQPFEIPPPPPLPPLADVPSAPLHRAVSMPEMMPKPQLKPVGTIVEEEGEEEENELENDGPLSGSLRRRSSRRSGGGGGGGGGGSSRSGTKWVEQEETRPSKPETHVETTPMPEGDTWDYFFPPMENVTGASLLEAEEDHLNKEEEFERKVFDEKPNRVDAVVDEAMRRKRDDDAVPRPVPMPEEVVVESPAAVAVAPAGKAPKKVKQAPGGSIEGKRMVEIFTDLDDHFLKASESAHEVSKMLEATRIHYHSNFADNRGHIDHSARVMRVITWNRSFRGIPNLDDGKDDFDLEEHETHATVLDKLLAWEKKLYDEVKAGEIMKFEYQRKVATLNKLKKRGTNSEALEKAKATVSHLHTRYIVDMQSLDSTVLEINRLRDKQLFPRLVQLVDGMATMWEIMQAHHEKQSQTVRSLSLLDDKESPNITSEYHHDRTYQLLIVVQEWQSQFEKLVNNQKRYIKALNSWLKLNLIPIESSLKEKVSSPLRVARPPIAVLLEAWHDHLEKLPDEIARTAIGSFAAVIDTIFRQQQEEMVLKRKCEDTEKDLARKKRQFGDWYDKYMKKKTPDEFEPDRAGDTNEADALVVEKHFVVEQLEKRLSEEKEAYDRQCRQVRQKSLGSLKNRLPELFRDLLNFSRECSRMYIDLRFKSQNLLSSGQSAS